jgi:hypothetical protein
LPNFSVAIHEATFSGVSTSTPKTFPSIAHDVAASRVSDRKTLPLDHVTQLGSLFLRMSPVVPLPVPDNPTSTTTLDKQGKIGNRHMAWNGCTKAEKQGSTWVCTFKRAEGAHDPTAKKLIEPDKRKHTLLSAA